MHEGFKQSSKLHKITPLFTPHIHLPAQPQPVEFLVIALLITGTKHSAQVVLQREEASCLRNDLYI